MAQTRVCFRVTYADGSSFQNRDGEPVVHFHFKTAGAQWKAVCFGHIGMLGILLRPVAGHRRRSRPRIRGRLRERLRPRARAAGVAAQSVARVPPGQPHDRASQGQRALPLWPRRGLLRLLAGQPADDVHVRLLEAGHAHRGGGPAQQDRSRVQQDPAQARRERSRHRLRLRRLHVPGLGTVWRPRVRREHDA